MVTDPRLERPLWRGRTNVDALTIQALEAAERRAGFPFEVTQGSYQGAGGDPNSAGTHDLGGVVDLRIIGLDAARRRKMLEALRRVGFAAWIRTAAQGPWSEHIHAVVIDHPRLAPVAARQVTAYRNGRNGLADNGPDDGPRISPIPVFQFEEADYMASEDAERKLVEILAIVTKLAQDEKRRAELNRERAARSLEQFRYLRDQIRSGALADPKAIEAKLDELLELEREQAGG